MSDAILTLNAGSSSLKFAAFEAESNALNLIASGQVEGIGATATGSVKSAAGQKAPLAVDSSSGRVDHDAGLEPPPAPERIARPREGDRDRHQ